MVDLFGDQVAVSIFLIKFALDKKTIKIGVEVALLAHIANDLQGLRQWQWPSIRSIGSRQGFKSICQGEHSCLQGQFFRRQPPRVAFTVKALMMGAGNRRNFSQMIGKRQRLEHVDGCDDMILDRLALLTCQRPLVDTEVIDLIVREQVPGTAVGSAHLQTCQLPDALDLFRDSVPVLTLRKNSRISS